MHETDRQVIAAACTQPQLGDRRGLACVRGGAAR